MDISEVEEILHSLRLFGLLAPEHVFITDEAVSGQLDGLVYFKGLAPSTGSVIFLSRFADATTVPHEVAHTLGAGEFLATTIGKLLGLKYELARKFPFLENLRFCKVKYEEVNDVPPKFVGRVKHYIRKS